MDKTQIIFTSLTACVAIYGATLSTYNAWIQRRDKRSRLRVALSDDCVIISLANRVRTPRFLFTAANLGQVTVTLAKHGFQLPDKTYLLIFHPSEREPYPHEVAPGKAFDTNVDPFRIARAAVDKGYKGMVSLRPFFADQLGNYYWGKPYKFDIDAALKTDKEILEGLKQIYLSRDRDGNLIYNAPIIAFDNLKMVTDLTDKELDALIVSNPNVFHLAIQDGEGNHRYQFTPPRQ